MAQPRRPKRPILNLGLLCCWRGEFTSVDILASTSLDRHMENSCLIRYMRNSIGFLKIKETDFVVSTQLSKRQFFIIGRFGEAMKILIISNDQR